MPTLVLNFESPWLANTTDVPTLIIPPGSGQTVQLARITSQSDSQLSRPEVVATFGTLPPGVNLSVSIDNSPSSLPPKGNNSISLQASLPTGIGMASHVVLLLRTEEGATVQAAARLLAASTTLTLTPSSFQVRGEGLARVISPLCFIVNQSGIAIKNVMYACS